MSGPDERELHDALERFQGRLAAGDSPASIVHELITHGSSMVLEAQAFTRLREHVGDRLGVSPNRDVYLVGSAKLGFSIAPHKEYRPFGDESDVDLAVVSPALYERIWTEVRRFSRQGGAWEGDGQRHFKNDHANGVIKAQVLPDSRSVPTGRMLFDMQAELQRIGVSAYKVTLAVWHSMEALEDYQVYAVTICQGRVGL